MVNPVGLIGCTSLPLHVTYLCGYESILQNKANLPESELALSY